MPQEDEEKDIPEEVRELLKLWDEGILSRGDFEGKIQELFFNPLEWLQKGEAIQTFGSCCCVAHPPERTFKVEVTIQPHGYRIRRYE